MIARIWHGWTTPDNADAYEALLRDEVLPGIAARELPGYHGPHVLRRETAGEEIEFVTVLWFASLEGVRALSGDDHETAYVPDTARRLLKRFDARSAHYEVRIAP